MASPSALARAQAAGVVQAVRFEGRALDVALNARPPASPTHAALVQEMAYGAIRWSQQLEFLANAFLKKPLRADDQDVMALLLVGLYQLRFMRVPVHAAVAETVEAAGVLGKPWAKKLVNAILRAYGRGGLALESRVEADPAVKFSHPPWLLDALRAAWPSEWQAIAAANNERPPMALRVNLQRNTRAAYLTKLQAAGIDAQASPEVASALVLTQPVAVGKLPDFDSGAASVQDVAAQWAAVLLDTPPGARVLDACAAPGGKTAHILERTPAADVLAIDKDPARSVRIGETLSRLRLSARVETADATLPDTWWDGRPFDRILLDAPCSATGVIRRHPDIKLHRTAADVARLQETQRRLLEALWPLLARGAKLLYVTCSVLPSENEKQIMDFCAQHADAVDVALTVPGGLARTAGRQILTGTHGMDGFYYACLQKR